MSQACLFGARPACRRSGSFATVHGFDGHSLFVETVYLGIVLYPPNLVARLVTLQRADRRSVRIHAIQDLSCINRFNAKARNQEFPTKSELLPKDEQMWPINNHCKLCRRK